MLARIAIPVPFAAAIVIAVLAWLPRDPAPAPIRIDPVLVEPPPPPPPPRPVTREAAIQQVTHQFSWANTRWGGDCRARGGHACCGQGGCCGVVNLPVSSRWSLGLTWVDGDVATDAVIRALRAPGAALDACDLEPSVFGVIIELRLPAHGPVRLWGPELDLAEMACVARALDGADFPRPASGVATVTAHYQP